MYKKQTKTIGRQGDTENLPVGSHSTYCSVCPAIGGYMPIFSGQRKRNPVWDSIRQRSQQDSELLLAVGLVILAVAVAYLITEVV
jgi:hypothetical protein